MQRQQAAMGAGVAKRRLPVRRAANFRANGLARPAVAAAALLVAAGSRASGAERREAATASDVRVPWAQGPSRTAWPAWRSSLQVSVDLEPLLAVSVWICFLVCSEGKKKG